MPERAILRGVNIVREGHTEPLLVHCERSHPVGSRSAVQCGGIALEKYKIPGIFVPRHEHPEHFLHVVLSGIVKYEVNTRGQNLRFTSQPGTIFLLPRGTVDETNWRGPSQGIVVSIHPRLLTNLLDETAHEADVELTERRWDLIDRHISSLLVEMAADLEDGSPAGPIYGESLANALGVYLLKRYAARPLTPVSYKGGLPGYRLKRVLDYIAASLEGNITLAQLSAIAGMSPHTSRCCSSRAQAARPTPMFCTRESSVPNNAFAIRSAASSTRVLKRVLRTQPSCACVSQTCRYDSVTVPSRGSYSKDVSSQGRCR